MFAFSRVSPSIFSATFINLAPVRLLFCHARAPVHRHGDSSAVRQRFARTCVLEKHITILKSINLFLFCVKYCAMCTKYPQTNELALIVNGVIDVEEVLITKQIV